MGEVTQQGLWWQQLETCRCQFDGQWEAVQPHTDFCNDAHIGCCQLKGRLNGLSAHDKEAHGRQLCEDL